MQSETKICQNCKNSFIIEPGDFGFYEKIKVPPPTWCFECRMVRRMLCRNERSLYRSDCGLCKKSVISIYAPENKYNVFCIDCYNSDDWDPHSFALKYDFNKPFFEQLGELFKKIPRRNLYQDFAVNSEYTNQIVHIKNSYLCFGGHHYEDSSYCAQNFFIRKCFRVRFGYYSEDCMDSWLIYNCRNCSNCIGCVNLRSQSYCIFNQRYTKEEYEKKLKELFWNIP